MQFWQERLVRQLQSGKQRQDIRWAAEELQRPIHEQPEYREHLMTTSEIDDMPVHDADLAEPPPVAESAELEFACRSGHLIQAEQIIGRVKERRPLTPRLLHPSLTASLEAGHVEVTRYLLDSGAHIARIIPETVLKAPLEQQVALFKALSDHGWSPNTPGLYGAVLLPRLIAAPTIFHWFVDHGADPNLGEQRYSTDRFGASDTQSCRTLQVAAAHGSLGTVQTLLNAGARIDFGAPLHSAAGVTPNDVNIYDLPGPMSQDFDSGRIPIMKLLVEKGADVNEFDRSRYAVPRLAIILSIMANAVERTKWLLEHGADPTIKGYHFTAAEHAMKSSNSEMRDVLDQGLKEQRWLQGKNVSSV